jgi:hypothetical protein
MGHWPAIAETGAIRLQTSITTAKLILKILPYLPKNGWIAQCRSAKIAFMAIYIKDRTVPGSRLKSKKLKKK